MRQKILIGIGTYKRNDMLENTLKHVAKLVVPENCEIEVVISDNNPEKDANAVFLRCIDYMSFETHYCHEPQKSIAAVRNAILNKALAVDADYVAFIDDDEYPLENWILALYNTMLAFDADGATSAPQQIVNGEKLDLPFNIKRRKTGSVRRICITNSVIFKTKLIKESNLMFDVSFGLMTGEDVDFFSRAVKMGYKFVWCSEILLYDVIVQERMNMEWQMDRAFNNGYLKIFSAKKFGKNVEKKYYKTLFDISVFSLLSIVCFFANQKTKDKCLMKLMNCFGKIKSVFSEKAYIHYKREF